MWPFSKKKNNFELFQEAKANGKTQFIVWKYKDSLKKPYAEECLLLKEDFVNQLTEVFFPRTDYPWNDGWITTVSTSSLLKKEELQKNLNYHIALHTIDLFNEFFKLIGDENIRNEIDAIVAKKLKEKEETCST